MTNTEPTDKAAAAAEQGVVNAAEPAASKKGASNKYCAPKGRKPAKGANTKAERPNKQANAGKKASKKVNATDKSKDQPKRESSNKKADVIAMMKRAKGVTLAEIVKITGWQKHTVRGFVSILGNKGGEKVASSKNAAGERTYKIPK
jgi:hypothetical protein